MREKKLDRSSIEQHLSMLKFLWKYKDKQFFFMVTKVRTVGVFVTQLSGNAGISV